MAHLTIKIRQNTPPPEVEAANLLELLKGDYDPLVKALAEARAEQLLKENGQ